MSKKKQYRPRLNGSHELWDSIIKRVEHLGLRESIDTLYGVEGMTDEEIVEENIKLAKSRQKARDKNRISEKAFREKARLENALSEYHKALIERLENTPISVVDAPNPMQKDGDVIVLQISDLHLNELVDLPHNKYDFQVASKRLHKLACETISIGKWRNSKKLMICFGGDLLNSSRRLDELLSQATNRSNASLLGAELLLNFLLHLADHFNITLTSVTGNESRIGQELGWSEMLATDSFDTIIFGILAISLRKDARFKFLPMKANESVFNVNGVHILQIHGHQVKRDIQKSIQEIIGKYSAKGIEINFVVMGHIHSTNISDYFARNASLTGSNAYAEEGLNFVSKAAQNVHIVQEDKSIHSIKIDLQEHTDIGYDIDDKVDCYCARSVQKLHTPVIIHQIVI